MPMSAPDLRVLKGCWKENDFEKSHTLYNSLPEDAQQRNLTPEINDEITEIIFRNNAQKKYGWHQAHRHFELPTGYILVGTTDAYNCWWTTGTQVRDIDTDNLYAHILVLTESGFHPYEYRYRTGQPPDLSEVNPGFFDEFADYLERNNLVDLVGLEVIDSCQETGSSMGELVVYERAGTFMAERSLLKGCSLAKSTGWQVEFVHGKPRATEVSGHVHHLTMGHYPPPDNPPPNSSHLSHSAQVPLSPDLNDFEVVRHTLQKKGILVLA